MKKSIDFAFDDHPDNDDDKARTAWAVAILDDCEGCEDLRIELTMEEVGSGGTRVVSHFSSSTARRIRAALATALRELGEDPGA